jgi:histidine decarboxylase
MPHLDSTAQLDALIDDVIFDLSPEYGLGHVIGQN